MASPKDIVATVLKFAIMIISIIILVKLTVDLVQHGKNFKTEQIIYYVCTYVVLLFALFGAWKEEFIYLVIAGVALILDLAFSWGADAGIAVNNSLVVALTVLVCVMAALLKFFNARSVAVV
uniref:Uncharacterized protein n=1 Tax=Tetranychus urticae TaxID=32264 RepID=T1KL95_TETUR